MSDQTPDERLPFVTPGQNFLTSVVTLHLENQTYPGGSTVDNLSLFHASHNGPIGYLHLHQQGAGDINVTGFIPGYPFKPDFTQLIFVKNDGPNNVVLVEEGLTSLPQFRFNFGGGGNVTLPPSIIGASILLIYDPDLQRWEPGP